MLQEDYKENLVARLSDLLDDSGITQKELSEKINVSSKTIQRAVNSGDLTNIHTLIEIANYFDVTVSYLIGESDERN
ncbi:helix-turn-helix domain-containing protein [Staphylococcus felis]|uniref:Helix-turn-helix transcriptional regulator n=1 Tax=Staphylococcus felis TaxID=46127 RepID=A0ABS0QLK0_9STAP|nr:helix-turn-helix transcriptional regulator [Staphylococcus felis]AVP37467.1 XRE family transcriptional regulator [Staphylococcus felis]MBH9580081.1 helix-turn-helix transcriptional regulator [Staphylococcus felis]PNZ36225.1 hypothetical protein CD143_04465 [Staphylococcus felis]QQB02583.1 helix-turn-helix transcriptional regulator [Staphylococcus felis]REI09494.1 XRE family transcriptional regulator [Staphylococcus felis]